MRPISLFMNRTDIPTYTDRNSAVDRTDFLQAIGTSFPLTYCTDRRILPLADPRLRPLSDKSVTLDFQVCGMFQVADPTPYYNDRLTDYFFITDPEGGTY